MIMSNKGFTLVELITTFALSSVIIIILVNIISVIKEVYTKSDYKTKLYVNQGTLSETLNSKFSNENLNSYTVCDDTDFCFIFNFYDGGDIKLMVENDSISFGKYTYKLANGCTINDPLFTKERVNELDTNKNNSFLIVKIPITCSLYNNKDFGVNVVYPYNSNSSNLDN